MSKRKSPLWIFVEEFGGYQSPDVWGIISNETELVVIEASNSHLDPKKIDEIPLLVAVPSSQLHFSCNTSHNLPLICGFKDHNFRVISDDKTPKDCIFIPNVIMTKIFKIEPKDKILLSKINDKNSVPSTSFIHYTLNESKPEFDPSEHANESIISSPDCISIKNSNSNRDEIVRIKCTSFDNFNVYADLLRQTSHRMILFHGQSGCGKTEIVHNAVNQLNFCPEYSSKIIYIDLLTSELVTNHNYNSSITFILDHTDEYLLQEPDLDENINVKYMKLCKKLESILQMHKENRVTLISRSSKIFSKFATIFLLPFDFIFTLEKLNDWKFHLNCDPFDSVFGLNEAKSLLELHILHPLQFSEVYKLNQMNLHSR